MHKKIENKQLIRDSFSGAIVSVDDDGYHQRQSLKLRLQKEKDEKNMLLSKIRELENRIDKLEQLIAKS